MSAPAFRNAKFEATGETKQWFGITLHRIRAVAAIASLGVHVGQIGGWIEREDNLSVSGNAWVYGNAQVYGDAQVYGNARVYGNAWVYGDAQVYGNAQVYGDAQVSPIVISGIRWTITIADTQMVIGCQEHDLARWWAFSDAQIRNMDPSALEFWRLHKPYLQALCAESGRPSGLKTEATGGAA